MAKRERRVRGVDSSWDFCGAQQHGIVHTQARQYVRCRSVVHTGFGIVAVNEMWFTDKTVRASDTTTMQFIWDGVVYEREWLRQLTDRGIVRCARDFAWAASNGEIEVPGEDGAE